MPPSTSDMRAITDAVHAAYLAFREHGRPTPAEMLERVENPELRAIIESMTRERPKTD